MMKKSGTGRKKIEIEKIRRDDYLHVTFSKRRAGLFKKASEICTLCDAETAMIVFSPAGKAFTFGHPSVNTVVDRFLLKETPPVDNNELPFAQSHQSAIVRELNGQYSELLDQLKAEKKKGVELKKKNKACEEQYWWNAPIETLSLDELEKLWKSMEQLKKSAVDKPANRLMNGSS